MEVRGRYLVGCVLSAEQPQEDQSKNEFGAYNSHDEDERNVEHNLGGDAADSLSINGSDFDNLLQALRHLLLRARGERESVVLSTNSLVGANVIENLRIGDL